VPVVAEELLGDEVALPRRLELLLLEIGVKLPHQAVDVRPYGMLPAILHGADRNAWLGLRQALRA
jgi:hypothetical protein